jgi:uncharacterized protein YbaR (Trm112 family)
MAIQVDGANGRENAAASTGMSEDLFHILVCPVDKHDLRLAGGSLVCVSCGRTYRISEGIPDMLVDEETAE